MRNINKTIIVSIILCLGILLYLPDSAHARPDLSPDGGALAAGTVGASYSDTITASGCGGPTYTWSLIQGTTLPAGLVASESGTKNEFYTITGMPTTAGNYWFRLRVQGTGSGCNGGWNRRRARWFNIIVSASSTVQITTTSVADGVQGITYSESINATNGTTPYSWDLTSGSLPPGLTLSATGDPGVISGTPTTTGSYNFTVRVIDSVPDNDTQALSIDISSNLAITTTSPLLSGTEGINYSASISGTGGVPGSYSWSINPSTLPPGITLTTSTGNPAVISGIPTSANPYNFDVVLDDGVNPPVFKSFSLVVTPSLLAIDTTILSPDTVAVCTIYSAEVTASNGTTPYTWTISSGVLPDGLSISPLGTLPTGTPTTISGVPITPGPHQFDVRVIDNNGVSRDQTFNLEVTGSASSCEANILDYTAYPPFVQLSGVKPNVLIMLDNSGSMHEFAYKSSSGSGRNRSNPDTSYLIGNSYYGYFKDHAGNGGNAVMYSYSGGAFVEDAGGTWNGDFLNWLTMRRIDVIKKVLVGGKVYDQRSTSQVNYLMGAPGPDRDTWKKAFGNTYHIYQDGDDGEPYEIIKLCTDGDGGDCNDSGDGPDYNVKVAYGPAGLVPEGLLHKNANRMRFGLMFFNTSGKRYENGSGRDGGYIKLKMGSPLADVIEKIEDEEPKTWTPLGESAYEAIRFYQNGSSAYNSVNYKLLEDYDPLDEYCQDNYLLILTDGASTKDKNLPGSAYSSSYIPKVTDPDFNVQDYMDDIATNEGYASQDGTGSSDGTYYLEGVAYYMHTKDLRTDLVDDQTVTVYTVFAFDQSQAAKDILKMAAKYGGFKDNDGDGKPFEDASCHTTTPLEGCQEWDVNNDDIPDTYYEASEGRTLEKEIGAAFNAIGEDTSSGTSASVLATTGEGEATVYQAYFEAEKEDADIPPHKVKWLGYIHGLYVDRWGNMREDSYNPSIATSGDKKLCIGALDPDANCTGPDTIVRMEYDDVNNITLAKRYPGTVDEDGNPTGTESDINFNEMQTLWEGGKKLFNTSAANRKIYTTINGSDFLFGDFTEANAASLRPYLRAGTDDEAKAVIKYIRGEDDPVVNAVTYDYRPRTLKIGSDTEVWKLGDIVYSTPMSVSKPAENYAQIYKDTTYLKFKRKYRFRRHVVYVGANDGMLHAFNGGFYDPTKLKYCDAYKAVNLLAIPPVYPGTCDDNDTGSTLGNELWGFIPQSLLPQLKWLTLNEYTHVYYVDLKPKIVDARIFTEEVSCTPDIFDAGCVHPKGWGTVIIGGMRFGGRDIDYSDPAFSGSGSRTFRSAYFAIDITDPLNPDLLWTIPNTSNLNETGLPDLGLTTSRPAVLRVGDGVLLPGTWYTVFGTGPDANTDINSTGITDSYEGISDRLGSVYIVNLATGAEINNFNLPDANSFAADPVAVDVNLNDRTDAIYVGSTFCQSSPDCTSSQWNGKMHRITTNKGDADTTSWDLNTLYDAGQSITAAPSLAVDDVGNFWIYFGTGRYYAIADSFLDGAEFWRFYGLKDNCQSWFDLNGAGCTQAIATADLLDTTSIDVYTDESITGGGSILNFKQLLAEINTSGNDGWFLDFAPGERNLYKPGVLGGIVTWTTYTPGASDACELSGTSRLWASFYKTGTAYKSNMIGLEGTKVLRSTTLGKGVPSSVGFSITGDKTVQGFIQQSTGAIIQVEETTPFFIRSKVTGWKTEN